SFSSCYPPHLDLHSFPTRRSSDLHHSSGWPAKPSSAISQCNRRRLARASWSEKERLSASRFSKRSRCASSVTSSNSEPIHSASRSEEHTSELQSPCNLVCRLLLEK